MRTIRIFRKNLRNISIKSLVNLFNKKKNNTNYVIFVFKFKSFFFLTKNLIAYVIKIDINNSNKNIINFEY